MRSSSTSTRCSCLGLVKAQESVASRLTAVLSLVPCLLTCPQCEQLALLELPSWQVPTSVFTQSTLPHSLPDQVRTLSHTVMIERLDRRTTPLLRLAHLVLSPFTRSIRRELNWKALIRLAGFKLRG